MFGPRYLAMGVSLAGVMVQTLIVQAAAKNHATMLAQMTPGVCWAACSTPCDQAYENCTAGARLNPNQLTGCRTVLEACRDSCRERCGLK